MSGRREVVSGMRDGAWLYSVVFEPHPTVPRFKVYSKENGRMFTEYGGTDDQTRSAWKRAYRMYRLVARDSQA